MALESMEPGSEVEADPAVVETFRAVADVITIKVWGGDWCGDCQSQLPAFAAVLEEAGIDPHETIHYPVQKEADGSKVGPQVEEYGIAFIPTIVIEQGDEELARVVESSEQSLAAELAEQLQERAETR